MVLKRKRAAPAPPPIVSIEGDEARVALREGAEGSMKLVDLVARIRASGPDSGGGVLPDGVKALLPTPGGFVAVHQTPPSVFGFRWIAPDSEAAYGPEARYRPVRIALPYVVVLAVYERGPRGVAQLSTRNECFFSNQSLDPNGVETELCYPALLNCSKFPDGPEHPISWICTQNLNPADFAGRRDTAAALRDGLTALLRHLFESGFNFSSEHHELNSWYSETVEAGVDPRIASVEDWEKASDEDPLFVLDVPWLKTGLTLRAIAERIHARSARGKRGIASSADLARLILNAAERRTA